MRIDVLAIGFGGPPANEVGELFVFGTGFGGGAGSCAEMEAMAKKIKKAASEETESFFILSSKGKK